VRIFLAHAENPADSSITPFMYLHGYSNHATLTAIRQITLSRPSKEVARLLSVAQTVHGWRQGSQNLTPARLNPMVVGGHSLGGLKAEMVAAEFPRSVKGFAINAPATATNRSFEIAKRARASGRQPSDFVRFTQQGDWAASGAMTAMAKATADFFSGWSLLGAGFQPNFAPYTPIALPRGSDRNPHMGGDVVHLWAKLKRQARRDMTQAVSRVAANRKALDKAPQGGADKGPNKGPDKNSGQGSGNGSGEGA
ncbi:MAG: hypothetical protein KGJ64_05755, partial [Betaproteobacteria bacterium]|nr:hypothetical protein [Betaproteobacteria bacterium]